MNFCTYSSIFALAFCTSALAEPGVKLFGGWIVGCSNENVCTAIRPVWDAIDGLPADPGMAFVQIRHHPQRDATPEVTLVDQKNPAPDAVLKPPLAMLEVHFGKGEANCKCKGDCPDIAVLYRAHIDGKGGYRFDDDDARSVLNGLGNGSRVLITVGDKRGLPLDTAHLDEALAHFDREQDLDGTPGALVLRPGNIMYDYAHPMPPKAETIETTKFTQPQVQNFVAEYPEDIPGERVDIRPIPLSGLVQIIRYKSADRDCGIFESWGHVGGGNEFVLVERREMPVCNGIEQRHWIQTYRADSISPETK